MSWLQSQIEIASNWRNPVASAMTSELCGTSVKWALSSFAGMIEQRALIHLSLWRVNQWTWMKFQIQEAFNDHSFKFYFHASWWGACYWQRSFVWQQFFSNFRFWMKSLKTEFWQYEHKHEKLVIGWLRKNIQFSNEFLIWCSDVIWYDAHRWVWIHFLSVFRSIPQYIFIHNGTSQTTFVQRCGLDSSTHIRVHFVVVKNKNEESIL